MADRLAAVKAARQERVASTGPKEEFLRLLKIVRPAVYEKGKGDGMYAKAVEKGTLEKAMAELRKQAAEKEGKLSPAPEPTATLSPAGGVSPANSDRASLSGSAATASAVGDRTPEEITAEIKAVIEKCDPNMMPAFETRVAKLKGKKDEAAKLTDFLVKLKKKFKVQDDPAPGATATPPAEAAAAAKPEDPPALEPTQPDSIARTSVAGSNESQLEMRKTLIERRVGRPTSVVITADEAGALRASPPGGEVPAVAAAPPPASAAAAAEPAQRSGSPGLKSAPPPLAEPRKAAPAAEETDEERRKRVQAERQKRWARRGQDEDIEAENRQLEEQRRKQMEERGDGDKQPEAESAGPEKAEETSAKKEKKEKKDKKDKKDGGDSLSDGHDKKEKKEKKDKEDKKDKKEKKEKEDKKEKKERKEKEEKKEKEKEKADDDVKKEKKDNEGTLDATTAPRRNKKRSRSTIEQAADITQQILAEADRQEDVRHGRTTSSASGGGGDDAKTGAQAKDAPPPGKDDDDADSIDSDALVEDALRSGAWKAKVDKGSGKTYYWRTSDRKACWDLKAKLRAGAVEARRMAKEEAPPSPPQRGSGDTSRAAAPQGSMLADEGRQGTDHTAASTSKASFDEDIIRAESPAMRPADPGLAPSRGGGDGGGAAPAAADPQHPEGQEVRKLQSIIRDAPQEGRADRERRQPREVQVMEGGPADDDRAAGTMRLDLNTTTSSQGRGQGRGGGGGPITPQESFRSTKSGSAGKLLPGVPAVVDTPPGAHFSMSSQDGAGGVGGDGGRAHDASATRRELLEIFTKYLPEDVDTIDLILMRRCISEADLLREMRARYADVADAPGGAAGAASSPPSQGAPAAAAPAPQPEYEEITPIPIPPVDAGAHALPLRAHPVASIGAASAGGASDGTPSLAASRAPQEEYQFASPQQQLPLPNSPPQGVPLEASEELLRHQGKTLQYFEHTALSEGRTSLAKPCVYLPSAEAKDVARGVEALYRRYAPAMGSVVSQILTQFEGHEAKLLAMVRQKYCPDVVETDKREIYVLSELCPLVGDVEELLQQWLGREDLLAHELRKKFQLKGTAAREHVPEVPRALSVELQSTMSDVLRWASDRYLTKVYFGKLRRYANLQQRATLVSKLITKHETHTKDIQRLAAFGRLKEIAAAQATVVLMRYYLRWRQYHEKSARRHITAKRAAEKSFAAAAMDELVRIAGETDFGTNSPQRRHGRQTRQMGEQRVHDDAAHQERMQRAMSPGTVLDAMRLFGTLGSGANFSKCLEASLGPDISTRELLTVGQGEWLEARKPQATKTAKRAPQAAWCADVRVRTKTFDELEREAQVRKERRRRGHGGEDMASAAGDGVHKSLLSSERPDAVAPAPTVEDNPPGAGVSLASFVTVSIPGAGQTMERTRTRAPTPPHLRMRRDTDEDADPASPREEVPGAPPLAAPAATPPLPRYDVPALAVPHAFTAAPYDGEYSPLPSHRRTTVGVRTPRSGVGRSPHAQSQQQQQQQQQQPVYECWKNPRSDTVGQDGDDGKPECRHCRKPGHLLKDGRSFCPRCRRFFSWKPPERTPLEEFVLNEAGLAERRMEVLHSALSRDRTCVPDDIDEEGSVPSATGADQSMESMAPPPPPPEPALSPFDELKRSMEQRVARDKMLRMRDARLTSGGPFPQAPPQAQAQSQPRDPKATPQALLTSLKDLKKELDDRIARAGARQASPPASRPASPQPVPASEPSTPPPPRVAGAMPAKPQPSPVPAPRDSAVYTSPRALDTIDPRKSMERPAMSPSAAAIAGIESSLRRSRALARCGQVTTPMLPLPTFFEPPAAPDAGSGNYNMQFLSAGHPPSPAAQAAPVGTPESEAPPAPAKEFSRVGDLKVVKMSPEGVIKWLGMIGYEDYVRAFRKAKITGGKLLRMEVGDLMSAPFEMEYADAQMLLQERERLRAVAATMPKKGSRTSSNA